MALYQDYVGTGSAAPGGHYRIGFTSGAVTGLTAGQSFFAFRWTDTVRFCRLKRVQVTAGITTAFGTAQVSDVSMFRAQNWTSAPTAGVSLTAPTSNNNAAGDQGIGVAMAQLSSLFPTLSNNVAISNTAALTTGSPTVDANAYVYDAFNIIALGSVDRVTLYDASFGLDYAISFGPNEGFLLQVPTAQGATGVVKYYVSVVFAANNMPM